MSGLGQLDMFARKSEHLRNAFEVLQIPNGEADTIVKKYHYLHRKRTGGLQLSHGIFYNGVLSGCLVWASPTFHHFNGLIPPLNQKEVVELARFWCSDDLPKHSETASLGRAIKQLRVDWERYCGYEPKVIVSYSDLETGHEGIIYKAANFEDWGFAKSARFANPSSHYSRTDERYASERYSGKGLAIMPRSATTKHMWVYRLNFTPEQAP